MILFGPLGNVSLSKGMKTIGAISLHQPADLLHVGLQIFQSPFIWLGVLLQLMFFVSYLLVLSWADYSFVQPAGSIAYAVVALWAHFLLHEPISPTALGRRMRHMPGRADRGPHLAAHHGAKIMAWETVLLLLIVVAGTSGELCVTRAMKTIGEVHDFRPSSLLRVMFRAMQVPWMWLGVALMAVAFFSLLGALSMENVSFVVPVTALSYAAGALGGQVFLGERVSRRRWLGVLLVCIGVTLVFLGRK